MRLITVRRTFEEGECHPIYLWGDWHVFNSACAKDRLTADRDEIIADPNAIYINMGDNGDFIGHGDTRFKAAHLDKELLDLEDLDELRDVEVRWLAKFEAPVVDKCVAALGSNHPNKFDRLHHTNTMKSKLERLGGEPMMNKLWCPAGALVRVVYTDKHRHACEVTLNLHHGTHTARYASTLLNQLLVKMRYWPEIDIMARGHCHFRRFATEQRIGCDQYWNKLVDHKILVALTGGYLKTFGEDRENYAEDMDLDPIDIGVARIDVYPSRYGARLEARV